MANRSTSQIRNILVVVGVVILLVAAIAAAISVRGSLAPQGTRRVTFKVDSSGGYANITLQAGNTKIEKAQTITTPWEKTVDVARAESVFLTASNPTQTGQLTCTILLDRVVWKTASIPAPKDGVACAGIIP
jgi:hypothetical protein